VTIKGMAGYKEFERKNELRDWLMNYLTDQDIIDMCIRVV